MALALALICSYVEALIPVPIGIPGVKLGLTNIVVVIVLYLGDVRDGACVSIARVLLAGFFLGPSATVACEGIKILLKLLLKGTSTAFVGDFANFVVGCFLVLPATVVYHIRKSKKSAIAGLALGTVAMAVFGSAFNAVYLLPKFSQLFHMSLDSIIAMGTDIFPGVNNVSSFVFFCVAPLNVVKGVLVSVLTMLLYKHVAAPLFHIREPQEKAGN